MAKPEALRKIASGSAALDGGRDPLTRLQKAVTGLRVLYALFFLSTGLFVAAFVLFGVGSEPRQLNPEAQAFTDALTKARIIDPLIAVSYVAGGLALLFRRTAPLGLIVLAPPVVVIVAFHLVLDSLWGVALVVAAVYALLIGDLWGRFRCLWTT